MQTPSRAERDLKHVLLNLHHTYENRYGTSADCELRRVLFRSLVRQRDDYLHLFFPHGPSADRSKPWKLQAAQGALDGAEYTAAAKGTACGHIFRSGESTYHCKTCAADDTCVLCARCFDASDHEGHQVFVSVSQGNSGCCDCGDHEAWRRVVACTIHTADATSETPNNGKERQRGSGAFSNLPPDLVESIRMTVARAIDFLCDVFSCSPEQMRLPKTEESVQRDEEGSRLLDAAFEIPDSSQIEYALVLWNDEKHTVKDVQNQVARACSTTKKFGYEKAMEVHEIGRSIVTYSTDLKQLLHMAEIIEHLKVTVTIRSSRDTFREQMCETIIDWISDISGCSVGSDAHVLRNIVCEELLSPWRAGGLAANKAIGRDGIDDHENEDQESQRKKWRAFMQPFQPGAVFEQVLDEGEIVDDQDDEDDEGDDDGDMMNIAGDEMEIEIANIHAAANAALAAADADIDMGMDYLDDNDGTTEAVGATYITYQPPPRGRERRLLSPTDSDDGDGEIARRNSNEPFGTVPRTPKNQRVSKTASKPSKHWLEKPEGFRAPRPSEPCEDLWQRVRLDYLILYDLRLWKTLRINLRHLYITTVITIPHFKRILGLRFAGLYTALAQLYLIADREPEHSIINLSVQMLTTPTITQEVVERGNFLSNLMAILYTFLTSRQVGFTEDVSPKAMLAFDAGAVTNRRLFHFFLDLRWLLQSEFILYRMRVEQRYLLQFLDLVKLHQGVCPNTRATGEHVEYESDAWISASMIVKEINKLCKHVGAAFDPKPALADDNVDLRRAIRTVAQVALINSFGCERKRFHAAEVKEELKWHTIGPFEASDKRYLVPIGIVQAAPMSFHHPIHYLLSWLIEGAKALQSEEVRSLLQFSLNDLKDPWNGRQNASRLQQLPPNLGPDELISTIFDHPLRVCVWLAQMKAGMWVRNGITLRHQAHTYRGVSHRDVGYQRDIFMIQAGFVLSGSANERLGERFLAQMIDRFQMESWVKGDYTVLPGFDEMQQIDVFEDFYHLLVIALSERGNLNPGSTAQEQHDKVLEHDVAHSLCFKPLSFSDLASRVTEKVSESDDFNRVLEQMTVYRAPEGLNDTGTFELKPQFLELVDPYYAHYSRNHREEAEGIYKKHIARQTDKKPEDVVYEPILQPITSGLFANLAAFTSTPLFVQVISSALKFAATVRDSSTKLQTTRVETFLHMVLHLALIATIEDADHGDSFIKLAALPLNGASTSLVSLLVSLSGMDEYASCHPTIKHILRKMQLRHPEKIGNAIGLLGSLLDRTENSSPASISSEDKERKKQEAKARQARIMAQMKQQQNSFLQNKALSGFDDDFDELDDMSITEEPESVEHKKIWSFPTGTCIWCQEETDDQKLYGTFAFLGESKILRSTPTHDPDFVREVIETPVSLDRSADNLRPFGIASKNKFMVQKMLPGGRVVESERQGLSKGFPCDAKVVQGPVATSCGHIMHYTCYDRYLANSYRRHQQQIARNQPENQSLMEFVCPLCKALGNAFLPIIWKAKECAHENELHAAKTMPDWLASVEAEYLPERADTVTRAQQLQEFSNRSQQYVNTTFAPSLVSSMQVLSIEPQAPASSPASPQRYALRRGSSITRFWPFNRNEGSQSSIDTAGLIDVPERMSRVQELMKAYEKLSETFEKNKIGIAIYTPESAMTSTSELVNPILPLSRSLGLSISAFEIAHRGVGSNPLATSLLAELPEQALIHFRIISETIESYIAVNNLRLTASANFAGRQIVNRRGVMIEALLGAHNIPNQLVDGDHLDGSTWLRLFEEDIFLFFVDWLTFIAPNVAEASNVLQLCVWAEVIKVAFVYAKVLQREDFAIPATVQDQAVNQDFANAIHGAMEDTRDMHERVPLSQAQVALLRQIVDAYLTTFLRKCILVMFVRYGLDFECPYDIDPEAPEVLRLTALLHIPSLDEMCALYASQSEGGRKLRQLSKRWTYEAGDRDLQITVPHPAIFELVGLPKTYDTLTEEAIRRKCPTTGKEIVDPAVCLFCGAIFCSQAVCCMKDKNKGGCYQHTKVCGGKVGVFIHIRKCMLLFVHGPGNGSYTHAPYLDKHGEPDPTLRRHHQLFLNQRRYDKLIRDVWLQHLIPTVISRKLEADINPGGWETL